jgi:hypothetical protein
LNDGCFSKLIISELPYFIPGEFTNTFSIFPLKIGCIFAFAELDEKVFTPTTPSTEKIISG